MTVKSNFREQVELTVDVLAKLLPFLNPSEVVERFGAHLIRGLAHPHEKVRSMALKEVSLEGRRGGKGLLAHFRI